MYIQIPKKFEEAQMSDIFELKISLIKENIPIHKNFDIFLIKNWNSDKIDFIKNFPGEVKNEYTIIHISKYDFIKLLRWEIIQNHEKHLVERLELGISTRKINKIRI